MAHVGLVHRDPCRCKVKSFRAVSFIERNVSKEALAKGATETQNQSFLVMSLF